MPLVCSKDYGKDEPSAAVHTGLLNLDDFMIVRVSNAFSALILLLGRQED